MAEMITFNSINLEDVAPVKIEDVRVSPVQMESTARTRSISPGSEFVRMRHGTRTASITFALLDDHPDRRSEALLNISRWAGSEQEGTLFLPQFGNQKYLNAICTALPEPSYRQWWESKLRITFTCMNDPYWNDAEEIPIEYAEIVTPASGIPPRGRIEHDYAAAVTNKTFRLGDYEMTFSSIPAGHLVIDLDRQTAEVNGASIMQYFLPTSSFLRLGAGNAFYYGDGVLYVRERWL